jgi:hypothetical protein
MKAKCLEIYQQAALQHPGTIVRVVSTLQHGKCSTELESNPCWPCTQCCEVPFATNWLWGDVHMHLAVIEEGASE